jgi:hypothetical protein
VLTTNFGLQKIVIKIASDGKDGIHESCAARQNGQLLFLGHQFKVACELQRQNKQAKY